MEIKKKTTKGQRLSKKQKGFIRDIIKGETGVQSALNNYDTKDYNVANQIAVENLQKPTIQNAIKSIADKIPNELLEKVHLEGLEAGKTIYKNNVSSGEVEEVGYEPDYAVRHKYLDTAYKLKGEYAPEKSESKVVIETISQEEKEALLNLLNDKTGIK